MIFLRKKKKLSPNCANWSIEKFKNFCLQKWIFGVFGVFVCEHGVHAGPKDYFVVVVVVVVVICG
jgi:hypothetical protein